MERQSPLRLHSYWRSSASYRVRIALNIKGVAYEQVAHDLRANAHRTEDYLRLNPQGFVPALETPGALLTQSGAIIEWLEETLADPPLLPARADERAIVRAMAMIVACDIHPLNNLRVLRRLRGLGQDQEQVQAWIALWMTEGFSALEPALERHAGRFAFGDRLTLADCYIVPQVYSAGRYDVDLTPYPKLRQVAASALAIPEVAAAHPDKQPDFDPG